MPRQFCLAGAAIVAAAIAPSTWADSESRLERHTFSRALSQTVGCRYLISMPSVEPTENQAWPLIVYLHGRCPDVEPRPEQLAPYHREIRRRMELPAILITPLCPGGRSWRPEMLIGLIDALEEQHSIDPNRVYLAGMSMGGFGTWDTVSRYPERFAAAVSLCGGADPNQVAAMKAVPMWNIHGAKDDIVPLKLSEDAVTALRDAGGYVIHTVEPDMDHIGLVPWHTDPRVYTWLLSQVRGRLPERADIPAREAMRQDEKSEPEYLCDVSPIVELRTFSRVFTGDYSGQYLLYEPKVEGEEALPLLVFLHGSGEKGTEASLLKRYGPMKLISQGHDFPMLFAAPQCPEGARGWSPEQVVATVEDVCANHAVDRSRIYLMGLSMGASGAWTTLSHFHDRFAGMVAVAGVDMPIDPYGMRAVPSRTYLAGDDELVNAKWGASMVARVADVGGDAQCIVVPGAKHLDMTEYTQDPKVLQWLFAQRRGTVALIEQNENR